MTPEQLRAGAAEARAVADKLSSKSDEINGHPATVDQAIGYQTLSAFFAGAARVLTAMADAAPGEALKPVLEKADAVGQRSTMTPEDHKRASNKEWGEE